MLDTASSQCKWIENAQKVEPEDKKAAAFPFSFCAAARIQGDSPLYKLTLRISISEASRMEPRVTFWLLGVLVQIACWAIQESFYHHIGCH